MEPSHYVINDFKLQAAVFLLKLEDSNRLGLFKDPEGGGGVVLQSECHSLKSKTIVLHVLHSSAAGLMTSSLNLLFNQSDAFIQKRTLTASFIKMYLFRK